MIVNVSSGLGSFGVVTDPASREPLITARGGVAGHALGVASHRAALLAAGQYLKGGLLLYGPPGTGKTHTVRYLLGQMGD